MKKIFVGNVEFSMTKVQLCALFHPYGTIERISLVTARDTGQSCACGFVEMVDSTAAEQAIAALNGKEWGGRPLIVHEVRSKIELGGPTNSRRHDKSGGAPGQARW